MNLFSRNTLRKGGGTRLDHKETKHHPEFR